MKTSKLRRKRIIIPAIATVSLLAVGATVWSATADDVRGDERDRVAAAAVDAAGGGRAVDVETSDDRGEAYEVEVRLEDGTEVDVALDDDLGVVRKDADDSDEYDDDSSPEGDDDVLLSDAERAAVEKAALAAVGGTSVNSAEASDDAGEAYEVEVLDADNNEWDVVLDEDLKVISKSIDN